MNTGVSGQSAHTNEGAVHTERMQHGTPQGESKGQGMAVDTYEGADVHTDGVPDQVPVAPFRDRYRLLEAREGLTLGEVAMRLGWTRKRGTEGDTTRAGRALGVTPESYDLTDSPVYREAVEYDTAVKLCDALHIDYFELGL